MMKGLEIIIIKKKNETFNINEPVAQPLNLVVVYEQMLVVAVVVLMVTLQSLILLICSLWVIISYD